MPIHVIDKLKHTAGKRVADAQDIGVPDGRSVLDVLETLRGDMDYEPIQIRDFGHNKDVVEIGTELESVALSWALNKNPAAQTVNGVEIPAAERGAVMPGPVSETTTYTIAVTDERGASDSASVDVEFCNGIYYGVMAVDAQINDDALYVLTRELQSGRAVTFDARCGSLRPVYACPERYGTPRFTIAGFEYTWEKIVTFDFTNRSGYTERYDVWMHCQNIAGSIRVTVS